MNNIKEPKIEKAKTRETLKQRAASSAITRPRSDFPALLEFSALELPPVDGLTATRGWAAVMAAGAGVAAVGAISGDGTRPMLR